MKTNLNGRDSAVAISLLSYLSKDELIQLFNDLVFLASFSHGPVQRIRNIIASLPRDWVLANIEKTANPLLDNGDYDEYRCLLELYIELDYSMAFRLAKRALANEDQDIKEAGEDYIQKLNDLGYKEN